MAAFLQAQTTPTPVDCQFSATFTASSLVTPSYYNKGPTAPCIAWRLTYATLNATGVSISLQGTSNLANGNADPAHWTNLTVTAPVVNPATGTTAGTIAACCDYYPWVRAVAGTFTGTGQTMSLTVLGYKGTSASRNTGGGSGTVTAVTATSPIVSSGSTTPVISLDTTKVPQKFFGTAAPGSVATNLPGDLFTDTTAHNEYVCGAPSGTAAPACTTVSAGGWLQVNGGGGGTTTAYTSVTFSSTPTFTVTASTSVQDFAITVTGNVTSSTLITTSATAGQDIAFVVCQDASGAHTFAWPTNVYNASVIDPTINACTRQVFRWSGSQAIAMAPAISDAPGVKILTPAGAITFPTPPATLMATTTGVTAGQLPAATNAARGGVTMSTATSSVAVATDDTRIAGSPYPTVGDGSPITWNLASATVSNGIVTLNHTTSTRALNISNPVNGGFYTLVVNQDGTGGAHMTLGTGCTWKVVNGGAGAIVLSAAASAIDILTFTYDGANCYAVLNSNFN